MALQGATLFDLDQDDHHDALVWEGADPDLANLLGPGAEGAPLLARCCFGP